MRAVFVAGVLFGVHIASAGPVSGSLARVREAIEANKDRATAACFTSLPYPMTVRLAVKISRRKVDDLLPETPYHLAIEADDPDDAFAACIASIVSNDMPSAPSMGEVFDLQLATPKQLTAHAIDKALDGSCLGRRGATPRTVTVEVSTTDTEVLVRAKTSPSNPDVESCFAENVRAELDDELIGVALEPKAHVTRRLEPLVTSRALRVELPELALPAAADCDRPDISENKRRMRVSVTAKRDADDFVVVVRSGDARRDECTASAVGRALHQMFETQLDDGTSYFRIDGDASARFSFEIQDLVQLRYREAALRRRD